MKRRPLFIAAVGNILEFYDFSLYGFFAATLGKVFFSHLSSFSQLLSAFSIFAASFLVRPLGAVIFGWIGDRYGRKTSLQLTLLFTGLSSLCIGILPGYAQIGVMAPILLTLLRSLQGICLGAEFNLSLIYISEEAERSPYKALWTGWALSAGVLGWFLGSVASTVFTDHGFSLYSWRVSFILGSVIAFLGFYLRKHVPETYATKHEKIPSLIVFFKRNFDALIQIGGIGVFLSGIFYGQFIAFKSHAVLRGLYDLKLISFSISMGLLGYMIALPFAGWLGDKIGRQRLMLYSSFAALFLVCPLFYGSVSGQRDFLILSQVIYGILLALFISPGGYIMSTCMPKTYRSRATSIVYNISTSIFGGLAPIIVLLLYRAETGMISPALYQWFCSFLGFLSCYFIYKTTR